MTRSSDRSTLIRRSTHIVRDSPRVPSGGAGTIREESMIRPTVAAGSRSLLIQEAIDEFLRQSEQDPSLSCGAYCEQFSNLADSLQSSIYRQLEVEHYLHRDSRFKENLKSESWPRPGDVRGSFTFIEEIGRGGASRVFLCTQSALGDRQVVVKVSRTSLGEADSLGRLRHRSIVPVLSVEEDRSTGLSMLCMPFLGRSTLHDYLDHRPGNGGTPAAGLLAASRRWQHPADRPDLSAMPQGVGKAFSRQQVIAWIGLQIADALAHAHDHGVFHGDVKPSNILLTGNGVPMLMDFNLAANLAQARSADGGTLPYMPPEQLRAVVLHNGSAGRYDQQSDVFSLGVVLYEALTGRLPFLLDAKGATLQDVATDLLRQQQLGAAPIRWLNCDVSPHLAELVQRCLQYQPQARIEDAAKLAKALQAELAAWAVFKARCAVHRRKLLAAAAAVVVMVGVAAVATANRLPRHERLFQEAAVFQEGGHHRQAQLLLEESLREQPGFTEAQFELGRSFLHQASYEKAKAVFSRLHKRAPSARSAAYIAYCFNQLGEHTLAIPWYKITLERGGRAAEVLNNLSYSYAEGSSPLSPREERQASYALLTEALTRSPELSSAKLNYLRCVLEQYQQDGVSLPPDMPAICRSLVQERPNCGQASLHAAMLFAHLSAGDPAFRDEGLAFLASAIELGSGPTRPLLARSSRWNPYRDDPRWLSILDKAGQPPTRSNSGKLASVVEPLSLARPPR